MTEVLSVLVFIVWIITFGGILALCAFGLFCLLMFMKLFQKIDRKSAEIRVWNEGNREP